MTAHGNDARGTEQLGGEHASQTNRAVTNHSHRAAGFHASGNSSVVAGAHNVCESEEGRELFVTVITGGDHNGRTIGLLNAHVFGLAAVAGFSGTEEATVLAGGLDAVFAVWAGVVAEGEGHDHQVTGFHGGHIVTDFLHHTDSLVADGVLAMLGVAPVIPQVTATHAGSNHAHHSVSGLLNGGLRVVLNGNQAGLFKYRCLHYLSFYSWYELLAEGRRNAAWIPHQHWPAFPGRPPLRPANRRLLPPRIDAAIPTARPLPPGFQPAAATTRPDYGRVPGWHRPYW